MIIRLDCDNAYQCLSISLHQKRRSKQHYLLAVPQTVDKGTQLCGVGSAPASDFMNALLLVQGESSE